MTTFQKNFLQKTFSAPLFFVVFFTSIVAPISSYSAVDYGAGRVRECGIVNGTPTPADITRNSSGVVTATKTGLDFNPTDAGKDIEFVLTNPVCVTVIATSYALVKGTIATMNGVCGSGSVVPRLIPSPFLDAIDIAKAAPHLSNPACAVAASVAAAAFGAAIAQLGIIYAIANGTPELPGVYQKTKICGANWMKPSETTYSFSAGDYKQTVESTIRAYIRNNDTSNLSLTNKTYREWYYGGVEVEDNPADGEVCLDSTMEKVNGQYPKQKYYLKGTETGNYNCKKYWILPGQNDPLGSARMMTPERFRDLQQSYNCCMKRSQQFVCIDYDNTKVFCQGGTRCTINGITFSTKSIEDGRLICAETYSLCPYNFTIGGGSEVCDYYRDGVWKASEARWILIKAEDLEAKNCSPNLTNFTGSEIRNSDCTYNKKAGQCRNYCQYLTHCTKTSSEVYRYRSSLNSPYFSDACMNFIGDSQNRTALVGGFALGSQKHFSAPIAQCIKETLENLFYNRAGHSVCYNVNEYPSANGTCPSGQYLLDGDFEFKKGNKVKEKSFFTIIQDNLRNIVKLVLMLSITFYGMNILTGKANPGSRKEVAIYLFKIATVLYFATGDAWQTVFFKGVYNTSTELSRMVFKIEVQPQEVKRDGCQFGIISLSDGSKESTGRTYPAGKEYLAIWDTIDCKIMRYLGFGPEASTANIAMLIISAYFTGPIGIYFALSVLIFGIMLIATAIRALHIFLASALSIIIFVFISPIIIPLVLFEKTKSIFDNWLKELISFCLQPMILFAYIAILIIVMDKTLIGSATYLGTAPAKTLSCAQYCIDSTTKEIIPYTGDTPPACGNGQEWINPLNDSVACLLNFNSFGKFPGFEIIGVSIPILINLFESNVVERLQTLLKGALVMYLIYKFMDEIPGITSQLIGGTRLPSSNANAFEYMKELLETARAIQKRAARAGKKVGNKAKEGVKNRANTVAEKFGNKGKSVKDNEGSGKDGDKSSSSKSGDGDQTGKT